MSSYAFTYEIFQRYGVEPLHPALNERFDERTPIHAVFRQHNWLSTNPEKWAWDCERQWARSQARVLRNTPRWVQQLNAMEFGTATWDELWHFQKRNNVPERAPRFQGLDRSLAIPWSDDQYEVIKPALRIASAFLTVLKPFFCKIWSQTPAVFDAQGQRCEPYYAFDESTFTAQQLQAFSDFLDDEMPKKLLFFREDCINTEKPCHGWTRPLAPKKMEDYPYYIQIALDQLYVLRLADYSFTAPQPGHDQMHFLIAMTLLHELAYSLWQMNPTNMRLTRFREPHFSHAEIEAARAPELGESLEYWLLGGHCVHMSCPDQSIPVNAIMQGQVEQRRKGLSLCWDPRFRWHDGDRVRRADASYWALSARSIQRFGSDVAWGRWVHPPHDPLTLEIVPLRSKHVEMYEMGSRQIEKDFDEQLDSFKGGSYAALGSLSRWP